MIPKLGKVQRVNVRDAWMNEATHFTPWLASEEGMELLQETLDMELEVEATEKFVGPFKADILAKRTDTTDNHWVLIENQLERTDHKHLGQLLTYAAGLDAVTIVWIAESFAEEHRAALDWLNDLTSDDLSLFGLEIELWQIEGSPPAPMFNIVAEPNEWTREVKTDAVAQLSETQTLQLSYWKALRSKLLERNSAVRPQKAHPQYWAEYAVGRSNTWLGASIDVWTHALTVEFAFRGPPGKVWYEELEAQKAEIEQQIPDALDWQRKDGNKMSRIAISFPDANPANEDDWDRQHAWFIEKLELFREVFRPYALALSDPNNGPQSSMVESPQDS